MNSNRLLKKSLPGLFQVSHRRTKFADARKTGVSRGFTKHRFWRYILYRLIRSFFSTLLRVPKNRFPLALHNPRNCLTAPGAGIF